MTQESEQTPPRTNDSWQSPARTNDAQQMAGRTSDAHAGAGEPAAAAHRKSSRAREPHEVVFITYPKLLFIWPVILAGFVLWPLGYACRPTVEQGSRATPASVTTQDVPNTPAEAGTRASDARAAVSPGPASPDAARPGTASPGAASPDAARPGAASRDAAAQDGGVEANAASADKTAAAPYSWWLGLYGWIYIWVMVVVLLTLGVDVERNQAIFWLVFFGLIWALGAWLHDVKNFTLFGDIYRWFSALRVQYNPGLGLALSVVLLIPYVAMLAWARLNDRWRITHNEFEHYSFGKMNDSLGRGAKSIRTHFPDVLELLLGLAGTLIVYNATGTKELRRIPHVMFLPFVRKRLNYILEKTAITAAMLEEEEDDDDV